MFLKGPSFKYTSQMHIWHQGSSLQVSTPWWACAHEISATFTVPLCALEGWINSGYSTNATLDRPKVTFQLEDTPSRASGVQRWGEWRREMSHRSPAAGRPSCSPRGFPGRYFWAGVQEGVRGQLGAECRLTRASRTSRLAGGRARLGGGSWGGRQAAREHTRLSVRTATPN